MSLDLPRRMHAERTADPAVMRWVTHEAALAQSPPGRRCVPESAPLHSLVSDGSISEVAVRDDCVLVRSSHPEMWRQIAPRVQAAISLELDSMTRDATHWLLEAQPRTRPDVEPATVEQVQAAIDRTCGPLIAAHGGTMTVVAVDATSVVLRAQGACQGCSRSHDTLMSTIAPALRRLFPDLVDVRLERAEAEFTDEPVSDPLPGRQVKLLRRRPRSSGPNCH